MYDSKTYKDLKSNIFLHSVNAIKSCPFNNKAQKYNVHQPYN